jgi:hypothetical protein
MTLINIPDIPSDSRESSVNFVVEFNTDNQAEKRLVTVPRRISAPAEDLLDCDAASTCASETESVILFDEESRQTSFVCGSSVIFRNLNPHVLAEDIKRAIESFGVVSDVNCPSFVIERSVYEDVVQEFNFGFASVTVSSPDEAALLNFLLQSTGLDYALFKQTPSDTESLAPDGDVFDDSIGLISSISIELLREDCGELTLETAERIFRDYLSRSGYKVTTLHMFTPEGPHYRGICQVVGNRGQLDGLDASLDGLKILVNPLA